MRLPPLNALKAFEATARHMSFAQAARELNVTPAALSHQVRGLEEFLQTKLFVRQTRKIALTDAGRALYPGVHAGFENFQLALRQLSSVTGGRILVISAGPAFTAKWLAPRLYRFALAHPDLDARISANLNFSDFVADGVDLGLRFGRGDYPDLFVEPLLPEAVMPLCSPAFLESSKLQRPEDLVDVTLIHDESLDGFDPKPDWDAWLASAGVEGVDTSRGLRFNLADHALDAARDGAGVVLGRRVLAQRDMARGELVMPFHHVMETDFNFYLVCPKGTETQPKVRAFRDWICAEIANDADDGSAKLEGVSATKKKERAG